MIRSDTRGVHNTLVLWKWQEYLKGILLMKIIVFAKWESPLFLILEKDVEERQEITREEENHGSTLVCLFLSYFKHSFKYGYETDHNSWVWIYLLLIDWIPMFKLMGFNVFIQTTDIIEGPCKVPGIEEKKKKRTLSLCSTLSCSWKRKPCKQIITQCGLRTNRKEKLICMEKQEQASYEVFLNSLTGLLGVSRDVSSTSLTQADGYVCKY